VENQNIQNSASQVFLLFFHKRKKASPFGHAAFRISYCWFDLSHLPDTVGKTSKLKTNGAYTLKQNKTNNSFYGLEAVTKNQNLFLQNSSISFCADNLYFNSVTCCTAKNFS